MRDEKFKKHTRFCAVCKKMFIIQTAADYIYKTNDSRYACSYGCYRKLMLKSPGKDGK